MAFQPAEAPAISGCSLIPPTTLGQKDAPERGAPGAKENGSMVKHVSDTSAARNNGGWLPLSEKFAPKGIPPDPSRRNAAC